MIGRITRVRKRDGRLVDFDETKIADAIFKAACAVGREERFLAEELAGVVTLFLEKQYAGNVPGIEEIQDMVERVLIETGHARMAKAFILYRERRARARAQVEVVSGEARPGPLVNNPVKARVSSWSKVRIADALVREADLDERIAAKVAATVEGKIFGRGVQRITTSVIRSLVEAELFDRGLTERQGRQGLVGLPRYDVDRLLRGKETEWRPAGPGDLKAAVADAVLAQYALSDLYSAEVVDAHLDARVHILDVGCPFEWLGAIDVAPAVGDADGWVEAVAGRAARLAPLVTRDLTLRELVPPQCRWAAEAGHGNAIGAARRLLGHSALRTLAPGGGRFRLSLAFDAVAENEGSSLLAEGLVREHWARFRSGQVSGLPGLILHVPAERVDTAAGRRALLPALAAAAETGRVLIRLDRAGAAALVTPSVSVPVPDSAGGGALPVAGAVALNVALLASGQDARREETLLEHLDGALALTVKALRQKRSFLGSLQADPSGPLYRVAAGARPLVAGGRGLDLVHLVGIHAAARRVEKEPAAALRLAGRLRSYAAVRVAEEGRGVRLRVVAAPERDGEAARRFVAADRGRADGPVCETDYLDEEPFALPPELKWGGDPYLEPLTGAVTLRFPREEAPAPEALYDGLCLLAGDARVHVLRLQPWPDRSVRAVEADV